MKGQLGNGTTTTSTVPVAVSNLSGVVATEAGGRHSLAVVGPAVSDLVVSKGADRGVVAEGSTVTYTITVANAGPSLATGVVMRDFLPGTTTFQSISSRARCTTPAVGGSRTVICQTGAIPVKGSVVVTIVVKVMAGGAPITNRAQADPAGLTNDPESANNTASSTLRVQ